MPTMQLPEELSSIRYIGERWGIGVFCLCPSRGPRFCERVVYLESELPDVTSVCAAVDSPAPADPSLEPQARQLHAVFGRAGGGTAGGQASQLALVRARVGRHVSGRIAAPDPFVRPCPALADRLRGVAVCGPSPMWFCAMSPRLPSVCPGRAE
jgi:hypothetical protein